MKKISLNRIFELVKEDELPIKLGQFNNCYVKGGKIQGSLPWHRHVDKDKLVLVVSGQLKILVQDQEVILEANDSLIIPKGVVHAAIAESEAWVLLIE